MNQPDITITLSYREAMALKNTGNLLAGALEDAGCDLSDVELQDNTLGVSPLLSAVMRLELALTLVRAEV